MKLSTPRQATKKKYLGMVAILLLSMLLTGCDLPVSIPLFGDDPTSMEENTGQLALIVFNVEIPPNTPKDEPMLLSVLDEVTGLALNTKRYTMSVIDDSHYTVGVPAPVGSVIKYRYSRQGSILAEEHISDGRPVRYRLYRVSGPGEVNDVITRWNDTAYNGPTGRITGTVSDTASGAPLANVMIAAGGAQTLTTGNGEFFIEGLPPGTHNLVAYTLDGAYKPFQQGATVAADSNTAASIQLPLAERVDVTFLVRLPEETPENVPLRLAGNLTTLGNTYANLSGGMSTLASEMPALSKLQDGSYGVILSLPVGADMRYKYTLGDGFWNAERGADGAFVTRQIIVGKESAVIEEQVETWLVGAKAPITFDVIVPGNTPLDEEIFIQFNPYGWTEPIPMWRVEDQRWAYVLYSPLDMIGQLGYRYCRAGQCGHADDLMTQGSFSSGQTTHTDVKDVNIYETVESWAWLENTLPEVEVSEAEITPRSSNFVTGIEFQPMYHPSWRKFYTNAMEDISELGANQVVLPSSWTFTRLDPPVLEPVAGQNPMWDDITAAAAHAREMNIKTALYAIPHFPTAVDAWWLSTPRDFAWWVSWFDRFETFALHQADLAAQSGADTLILGGDWISPALPDGELPDGRISNVPVDANKRYRDLIEKIRGRFDGTLAWALPYSDNIAYPPSFINQVDQIYVLWSAPLSEDQNATPEILQAEAKRIIDEDISAMRSAWTPKSEEKPVVLGLAYPSVQGTFSGCLPDPIVTCLAPDSLNFPAPDYPLLHISFEQQAKAYDAVLTVVNQYDWISGVISRGYYPPVILQDKSTSVHGKPSADVLHHWFTQFSIRE
ncbi:MAG: carboxypeptidase regulatory-like domain-containing protein [Chloroflexota bacterium]